MLGKIEGKRNRGQQRKEEQGATEDELVREHQ